MSGEILTLGLGNYGVLTASHWINSTTRYDLEQRVVYRDSRSGPVARLLLLDQAQPSRVRREVALGDNSAVEACETDLHPHDEEEHEGRDDDEVPEEENDELFQWTWETARRHPNQHQRVHMDPASAAAGESGDAATPAASAGNGVDGAAQVVELEDAGLEAELRGAPPQKLTPWWRYISVPTDRSELLTNAYFDDPIGGLLAHSFGFGYHQSFEESLFGATAGRSTGRMAGLDTFGDRLRRQLEDSDAVQGLQLFVDGDSAFGGVACALLRHLREEHEDVRATMAHTIFPTFHIDPAHVDFAARRKEESLLNRALCVTHLAEYAGLYAPLEPSTWQEPLRHLHDFDVDDDVATSAITAAVVDTATYASRQQRRRQASGSEAAQDEDGASAESAPFRSFGHTCGLLRPSDSLRIVATATALPIYVPTPAPSAMHRSSQSKAPPQASLWSVLSGSPLLDAPRWAPLTHAFRGANSVQLEASAVTSHVVSLRGVGLLPDVEYPRSEAMLRYVYTMRTPRYAAEVFNEGYAVSSSFPVERLFGQPKVKEVRRHEAKGVPEAGQGGALSAFNLGAHWVNTYQTATYTKEIVEKAEPVMRYAKHTHGAAYGFEDDEWREALETLHAVHDSYDHADVDGCDDSCSDD